MATPTGREPSAERMLRRIMGATFHYGIGRTLPRIVRFLLIPVFTLFLSPTDYGILELALAAGGVLVIMMHMGVPGAVTRFYFDYREGVPLQDYVTTIAYFLFASSLIIAVVALVLGPLYTASVLGFAFYPFGILVIVAAALSCGQNLQDRLVQAREQARYAAMLNVARATVSVVAALFFVVLLRWGAAGMLLAEVIMGVLFCAQALYYLRPELSGRCRLGLLGGSLTYALGILPHHLMGTFSPLITRSFLAHVDSLAAVGLMGIATRFMLPATILIISFQTAYNPVYFSVRTERDQDSLQRLAATARIVWTIALGAALAAALFVPPLLVLVTPQSFHQAAQLLPILTVGFLGQVLYTLLGPEMFYQKKTWLIPVVSGMGVFTTIAITLLTAKSYGVVGMAWATSMGSVVTALMTTFFARRLVSIPHKWFDLIRASACGAGVAILAFSIPQPTLAAEFVVAVGSLILFLLLLRLSGDPTIRDAVALARTRWTQ